MLWMIVSCLCQLWQRRGKRRGQLAEMRVPSCRCIGGRPERLEMIVRRCKQVDKESCVRENYELYLHFSGINFMLLLLLLETPDSPSNDR